MRESLVTDVTDLQEPISLLQAKRQIGLNVDEAHPRDEDIEGTLIPGARERAEIATWRAMREGIWDLKCDRFPCEPWIELPKSPLIAVVSVTYVDVSGVTQTWSPSEYIVDVPTGPKPLRGRLAPAYSFSWPSVRDQINAVTIRIRAGYGATDGPALPRLLQQAMLLDVSTMFAQPEETVVASGVTSAVSIPRHSARIYGSFKSEPSQRRWS